MSAMRYGWQLSDLTRLPDGDYRATLFHHSAHMGVRVHAATEELALRRAEREVDEIQLRKSREHLLRILLDRDEADTTTVRRIPA